MAIDQEDFRRVMGHFASGVTVVTTVHEDVMYGITVSSFTSLSLEPQLILICIDKRFASHPALQQSRKFAVNILAEDGEHLSRHFASRDPDKFRGIAYHNGVTGAPLLDDALAVIECALVNEAEGGDHTIFIGGVLRATVRRGKPLIYYRSGYHELA